MKNSLPPESRVLVAMRSFFRTVTSSRISSATSDTAIRESCSRDFPGCRSMKRVQFFSGAANSSVWSLTMANIAKDQFDYIVVGAGAAGSVLAAELSASGAEVLVVESGGPDEAPTIANPSIWFYNVG